MNEKQKTPQAKTCGGVQKSWLADLLKDIAGGVVTALIIKLLKLD